MPINSYLSSDSKQDDLKVLFSEVLNAMDWRILLILSFPAVIQAVRPTDSPVDCQRNNSACDNHDDNLIESFPGVETILECRELCLDKQNSGCEFITYFGDTGSPLKNVCELFRSCETTVNCSGSEMKTRFRF